MFLCAAALIVSLPGPADGRVRNWRDVCPGRLVLTGTERILFTQNEKILLCGDPSVPAWKVIPAWQVQFHLKTFLQSRGFYSPVIRTEGETLRVDPGQKTILGDVKVEGGPPFLDIRKWRRVRKRPLTPSVLDEIEKWTGRRLENRGYPCPVVASKGDVVSGDVEVSVTTGPFQRVGRIDVEPVPGLDDKVLRRFDAFRAGQPFHLDLLTITSWRLENEGLLQSNVFNYECGENSAAIHQDTFGGKPRLLTFGIGADTEQLVLAKLSWKHANLGRNASTFSIDAFGSYKVQTLYIASDWYVFSPGSRWYLMPSLSFSHERETQFHFVLGNARMAPAVRWDSRSAGFLFSAGPNFNLIETFRGPQEGTSRFLSLRFELQGLSHDLEYDVSSPRQGFQFFFRGDLGHHDLASEVTVQRFQFRGKYLYNLLDREPPVLVVGLRGGIETTLMSESAANLGRLPPNYRSYLGGTSDLRGFSRKELPDEDGALSAVFLGLEIRWANFFPLGIEPFVFFDAGVFGDNAFRFGTPVYYSPGVGVRLQSPIGIFRTTLAHGFKAGGNKAGTRDTHFQFFISYGEEF